MRIILASASAGRKQLLETLKIPFEVMETDVDEEKIADPDPVKMAAARAEAKAENALAQIFNNNSNVETHHDASHAGGTAPVRETRGSRVSTQKNNNQILIIAADTVGYQGNWIFGKPRNRKEAEEMLRRLSGKTHRYVSAHCILRLDSHGLGRMDLHGTDLTDSTDSFNPRNPFRENPASNAACLIRENPNMLKKIVDYDVASVTLRRLTPKDIAFYLDRVPFTKLCGAIQIMNSPQNFVVATHGSLSTIIGLCLEKVAPLLSKQINTDL